MSPWVSCGRSGVHGRCPTGVPGEATSHHDDGARVAQSPCPAATEEEEEEDGDEELLGAGGPRTWTPQEKLLHEARLKAKAKRRLRRTSSRDSTRESLSEGGEPGPEPGSPKGRAHDRRSRMGKGRGLPKKGEGRQRLAGSPPVSPVGLGTCMTPPLAMELGPFLHPLWGWDPSCVPMGLGSRVAPSLLMGLGPLLRGWTPYHCSRLSACLGVPHWGSQ